MKEPLSRWCPNPGCSAVIKLDNPKQKKAVCQTCKTEVCTLCNRISHGNVACAKVGDHEFKEWIKQNDTGRCPKCKMMVEKLSGCNHMTCQICR